MEALTITAMGSQGDGLAEGGRAVPFALPGETVQVRSVDGRVELAEILEASADRVAPSCPHFGACGGCALQHWAAGPYLDWKGDLVARALAREGLSGDIGPVVPVPPRSRRRLAIHARQIRGRAELGFKSRRSWTLVPVSACEIAHPEIVSRLEALRRIAEPLFASRASAPTLHVTATLTGLAVDITGVDARRGGLSADRRAVVAEAAARADLAQVTLAGEPVYAAREPVISAGGGRVVLPPGGFLQACEPAEREMVRRVTAACAGASRVADLFCGVGTFTLPIAAASSVLASDSSELAVRALRRAAAGAANLKAVDAEVRDLFRRPMAAKDLRRCDVIVFDPPRAGAEAQSREIAGSDARRVVAVSCNPASFARDARILVDAGFRLGAVTPIDQFLWSAHVELVAVFER